MESTSSTDSMASRRRWGADLQEGTGYCDCGVRVLLWTSWTNKHPGRRFYDCRNYAPAKDGIQKQGCNYFKWIDSEIGDRAKDVINGLKAENSLLLKEKCQLIRDYATQIEVKHGIQALETNLCKLKIMHKFELEKVRLRLKKAYFALILSWLLIALGIAKYL
ncbi:hypothetical protein C2S52_016683 [Perilla frutescens var. hirtella]|nr:hypothetical protein C2S52_016683 [Perilla frutescens var. hirtella]